MPMSRRSGLCLRSIIFIERAEGGCRISVTAEIRAAAFALDA